MPLTDAEITKIQTHSARMGEVLICEALCKIVVGGVNERAIDVQVTLLFCFFNDTATTEIYTLSLHDALPIWGSWWRGPPGTPPAGAGACWWCWASRSEEHTSELQSRGHLVCRLLLEKKQ